MHHKERPASLAIIPLLTSPEKRLLHLSLGTNQLSLTSTDLRYGPLDSHGAQRHCLDQILRSIGP